MTETPQTPQTPEPGENPTDEDLDVEGPNESGPGHEPDGDDENN